MPQNFVKDETTGQLVWVREGETPEQAVQRSRSRRPDAFGTGILNPADQPKGDLTEFGSPNVLRQLLATALKTGSFGASMLGSLTPAGIATRMTTTGLLGGAANKVEGQDFLPGFAGNAAGEAVMGGIAAKVPRIGTRMALGLSNLRQNPVERAGLVDAFMRERAQGRLGSGIAVGDVAKSEARRAQIGDRIPKLDRAYDQANVGQARHTNSPFGIKANFGGVDAAEVGSRADEATKPITLLRSLAADDRETYIEQIAFHYRVSPERLAEVERQIPGTLDRLADTAHISAERLGKLARTSKGEGQKVIDAWSGHEQVGPAKHAVEGQMPAARAGRINSFLDEVVPKRKETRRRYADVANINEANKAIHSSVGQASVRGGLGAGLFGGMGAVAGGLTGGLPGAAIGSGVGGAVGLLAAPRLVSGTTNTVGRMFEPKPWNVGNLTVRGTDIGEDISRILEQLAGQEAEDEEIRRRAADRIPVGRRQP